MDNYVGKRLDGRYEIQEIIGVGGMAVVYKAYDSIDDRIVAIKILKEEFLANEEFRRRFKNESKAIAVLSHPNIVKVYDVSFGDNLQYITMEYIDGITLKEYIEQQRIVNWKEALHFTTQILRALQHAHDKGIVHRDVKPQNIMLLQNGNIKVADFGIARFSRNETRTMTESAIGSVHYISPEQARGEITDEKADIYSVGVVLYEMLTGQLPFQSDNAVSVAIMQLQSDAKRPREINENIPLGLEQITLRAMQKNPRDRYQSAAEMLLDLDEFKRNPSIKFDYDYFVDTEPTKFVSPNSGKISSAVQENYSDDNDSKKKTVAIVSGVTVALVAVIGVVLLILSLTGNLGGKNKIEVDNFIGLNYDTEIAGTALEEKYNFKVNKERNTEYEEGEVIGQTPKAGTKISEDDQITLTVATRKDTLSVPDVYGKDSSVAKQELSLAKLIPEIVTIDDASVKEGKVIRTSPERGEPVAAGDKIQVFVSTGKNSSEVSVPPIVDITVDEAKELLASLDLSIGQITEKDSDKPKGTILQQSIKADSKVPKGTVIDVVVSKGTKSVKLAFNLPDVGGDGELKAFLNNDQVATAQVLLNGNQYDKISVSGTGTNSEVTVTINGKTIYKCTVDFEKGTVSDEQYFEYSNGLDTEISVPNVVNLDKLTATTALRLAGFKVEVEEESVTNESENGVVLRQSATSAKVGSTITIVVGKYEG